MDLLFCSFLFNDAKLVRGWDICSFLQEFMVTSISLDAAHNSFEWLLETSSFSDRGSDELESGLAMIEVRENFCSILLIC
jgi:hypothetical protein